MPIRFFQPSSDLRDVVARIYAHEAPRVALGGEQSWLIVPDGEIKIIFPYHGDISCSIGSRQRLHRASRLIVSGMRTEPGALLFQDDLDALGVIVRPEAAYRLFDVPHHEIANQTFDGEELFGASARRWQEELANLSALEDRVAALQTRLSEWVRLRDRRDLAYECAVRRLQRVEGCVRIEQVASATGCSLRTLERRFRDRLGIGAKAFADVLRFHAVYRRLRHPDGRRYMDVVGERYVDQSHFLKAFKRYTGTTPRRYAATEDYGRLYIPE